MEKVWTQVEEGYRVASIAYYHDQLVWNVVLFCAAFTAVVLWPKKIEAWLGAIPRRRGRNMRKARRDFIRSDTIDALVDHIEKRVAQGDYTRKEAKELYREAKKAWQIKDLFPNPELLKENIKKRLARKENTPVPLPSTMPKARHMFDKPAKA